MALSSNHENELLDFAKEVRRSIVKALYQIQTGHPGGSLSCVEILTVLYKEKMNFDPANPYDPNRDRLVLSKGHGCPTLYIILAELGVFPKEEVSTLRQLGSRLQGHPDMKKLAGIEMSSGPLGLGLSAGLGMALAAKMDHLAYRTFVVLGDGELQEGIVWEAAMCAAKYETDNLTAIVDLNGVQLDGTTDEVMPLGDIEAKFQSFGWQTVVVDGHDLRMLAEAVDTAQATKGQPTVILAETVKGKVFFYGGKSAWHGRAIDGKHYEQAMRGEVGVRD